MDGRTRAANGESWISKTPDKDGWYHAFVTMGPKGDGKELDRRHRKRRDPKDLKAVVRELERKRDAGVTGKGKPPTVSAMLARRLKILRGKGRAVGTLTAYESVTRVHIAPRIGARRIDRLLPEHIEDMLDGMAASGVGAARASLALAFLSSALEVEFRRGNIGRNPCVLVENAPEVGEPKRRGLTEKQAVRVIRTALKRPNGARWPLRLLTGMRQGETLGAQWDRLDEPAEELGVEEQLQRNPWRHGCAEASENLAAADEKDRDRTRAEIEHECARQHCKTRVCPKRCKKHARACPPPCPGNCTAHARLCPQRDGGGLVMRVLKEKRGKTVPLGPAMMKLIREHRERQFEQKLLAMDAWDDRGLMFCREDGSPIDPRDDWREWKEILAEAGVPHIPLHGGRHAAATIMMEKGVALAVTKEILGHSNISITQGYVHVSSALAKDAARRMDSLLADPGEEPA